MNDISQIVHDDVDAVLNKRLQNEAQQAVVVAAIMAGFAGVPKKPVPDEVERTQALESQVSQLAKNLRIGFVGERLVVKTAGSSESLLVRLRRGSDWYAPWEQVDEILLAAAFTDPTT